MKTQELTVLVVDDDATNRKLLRVNFEHEHAKVLEAGNGKEALRCMENQPVDAVISDLNMPEMDGYEFCRAWRRKDPSSRVPVVVFSATATSPKDEAMALEAGADSFLRKPTSFDRLLKTVQSLLNQRAEAV